jgi:hypothetical protein
LTQLERQLRKRGLLDRRIVEEAREHLYDAIAEGLQRGLSVDAAEREAFVRFGPPETVAAHVSPERYRMSNRLLHILTRIAGLMRRNEPHAGQYHDVAGPSRYHFALRLRRRYRNRFQRMSADQRRRFIAEKRERGADVSAFETDPRERLVQFLREFGLRRFGSSGTLESLTLLEETADASRRGGRYLAAFSSGTKMIWTVNLSADGRVSFDGTSAPA